MQIDGQIVQKLQSYCQTLAYEIGGILGSSDGSRIDRIVIDDPGAEVGWMCRYTPNVVLLNEEIQKWQIGKIHFFGVFHTHFHCLDSLSQADKAYIERIMRAMPKAITVLYFPVFVLPNGCFVGFKAVNQNGNIIIQPDTIEVVS